MATATVAAGVATGLVVAALAVAVGTSTCGQDLGGECLALARTFAVRVGLVTGAVAVIMLLTVAGLARMAAHDEARRARQAEETAWE